MSSALTEALSERDLLAALDSAPADPAAPAESESSPNAPAAAAADGLLIAVDDVERALGEIEAQKHSDEPATSPPPPIAPAPPTAAEEPAAGPPAGPADPAPAPVEKPLKFVIGKKPKPATGDAPESVSVAPKTTPGTPAAKSAATVSPAPPASQPSEEIDSPPAPGVAPALFIAGRRAYRGLESGLDLLSRPVARLGPDWLRGAGIFGVTTILISAATILLRPVLMPHEDAVTYLAERREAIANPPPPADEGGHGESGSHAAKKPAGKGDSHGKADGHGSSTKKASKPKSDGHGAAAKPKKADKSAGHGH